MKKLVYTLFLFPLFLVSQNLDVADSATLTIGTGGSMTITGTLTSNTSGSIIIQTSRTTSGSLIAKAGGNSQGKGITLARSLDGGDEWALLGVPVTGETSSDVDDNLRTKSGKSALGHFDPSVNNGEFVYYNTNAGTSLTNGKGYLISPNGAQTVNFTGTMSVANVTYDLADETGTYGNWNLIGNPYPSYLHMTDDGGDATNNFLTVNAAAIHDTYEAVYAWDGANYDIYNQTSNSINHIAPGEGFFVYAVAGAATDASFTEAMQTSGQGANFNASIAKNDFKRESVFKIKLKDETNSEEDYLKLFFSDQTTKGLDPGYDAGKFFQGSESKVFSRLIQDDKGIDLQIQALPYNDLKDIVVPLGITTKSSRLELSVEDNTIDHLYNIFLEDRLNNTIVEFDKSIELDFDDDSKGLGRFYLHFTDGIIPELPTDGDDFRIYKLSSSELRLMGSPDTMYNAKVYDFSGRLMRDIDFTHRVNINEIDSRGINILTIESKDKKITKKFKLN